MGLCPTMEPSTPFVQRPSFARRINQLPARKNWPWARNAVLEREVAVACEVAKNGFNATGAKSRLFHEFEYAARSWRRTRRVSSRIEHGPKGRETLSAQLVRLLMAM